MAALHKVLAVAMFLALTFPVPIIAQNNIGGPGSGSNTGDGGISDGFNRVKEFQDEAGIRDFGTFSDLILTLLQVLTAILAAIAVAAIIYGGFLYISSAGDEGKAEHGKQVLIYAIIGLLIVGAAGIIVNIIINIFVN